MSVPAQTTSTQKKKMINLATGEIKRSLSSKDMRKEILQLALLENHQASLAILFIILLPRSIQSLLQFLHLHANLKDQIQILLKPLFLLQLCTNLLLAMTHIFLFLRKEQFIRLHLCTRSKILLVRSRRLLKDNYFRRSSSKLIVRECFYLEQNPKKK